MLGANINKEAPDSPLQSPLSPMDTESRLRTRVPDTNTGPTNTTKKNKPTVEGLNDSAVSLKAVLDQDSLGIRRESIKQAWGPNKDSLSASANSSSFERRSEGVSLSDMNIRGISEENFGRVCVSELHV